MTDIFTHTVLALALQTAFARLCRSWLAGALAASAWFISREITQAEYRWIEAFGGGLRRNMPWWGGFDYRVWQSADPWLDWLVPSAAAIGLAVVMTGRERRRQAHRAAEARR